MIYLARAQFSSRQSMPLLVFFRVIDEHFLGETFASCEKNELWIANFFVWLFRWRAV
jgi:hypothetical protein